MIKRLFKNTFLFAFIGILSCGNHHSKRPISALSKSGGASLPQQKEIILAANRTANYVPLLRDKNIAVVANPTSVIKNKKGAYTHLVDSLLSCGIKIEKVFAPEHGFRGSADAGEHVSNGKDPKTGLPVLSLYGNNRKPSAKQLAGINMVVFDLQDVGARFYTYLSTLHYIMEACAEQHIKLLLLDRPNPNAGYIDGPVLETENSSFVGMHPVPVVYGMTIGEYAQMINGEKWLKNGRQCNLQVVNLKNYAHNSSYKLPVKPSPNLPNAQAVNLYPSLCFFEGTTVNAGRGTKLQFQVFGAPSLDKSYFHFSYIPKSRPGAKNPKHLNETCYGKDLSTRQKVNKIHLEWLLEAYAHTQNKASFFNKFFNKLAGTEVLQQQIEAGKNVKEIRKSWQAGLEKFKNTRKKYILYP